MTFGDNFNWVFVTGTTKLAYIVHGAWRPQLGHSTKVNLIAFQGPNHLLYNWVTINPLFNFMVFGGLV